MDAATAADYATRLNATRLRFARKVVQDGNVVGIEQVPWDAVIVRCMVSFGWVVVDQAAATVTVTPLRLEP